MPINSVVHFAVFAAGAALGATAAALAQRRNDRFTLPVTPAGSTSAISRNTEILGTPVVEVSSTGNLGLARFQGVGSEVLKYGVPGESFIRSYVGVDPLRGLKPRSFQPFLRMHARMQIL